MGVEGPFLQEVSVETWGSSFSPQLTGAKKKMTHLPPSLQLHPQNVPGFVMEGILAHSLSRLPPWYSTWLHLTCRPPGPWRQLLRGLHDTSDPLSLPAVPMEDPHLCN